LLLEDISGADIRQSNEGEPKINIDLSH
jgi:hypothetical protein